MKRRKLALVLAVVIVASSAVGPATSVIAAEQLEDAEVILEEGDAVVTEDEQEISTGEELVTSDSSLASGFSIESVETLNAEESAQVEEEFFEEGGETVTTTPMDVEYTVGEGEGIYDADAKGDVFTFTAPETATYRASLNISDKSPWLELAGGQQKMGDRGYLIVRATKGEKIKLGVSVNTDDTKKYRFSVVKIPTVTAVTVTQTREYIDGINNVVQTNDFLIEATYDNGSKQKIRYFDQNDYGYCYDRDTYGYSYITVLTDKDGNDLHSFWGLTAGKYKIRVSGELIPETTMEFRIKPVDISAYPTLKADIEYQITGFEYYQFKPEAGNTYFMDDYVAYTKVFKVSGNTVEQIGDIDDMQSDETYLVGVQIDDENPSDTFMLHKKPIITESSEGKLILNQTVDGTYKSPDHSAYIFTPTETGYYILTGKLRPSNCFGYVKCNDLDTGESVGDMTMSDKDINNIRLKMEANHQYQFYIDGEYTEDPAMYNKYSFVFQIKLSKETKTLTDMQICEGPIRQFLIQGMECWEDNGSYEGLKVKLTYSDNSTEIVEYNGDNWAMVDSTGNKVQDMRYSYEEYSDLLRIKISYKNYIDTIDIPYVSPSTVAVIQDNKQNAVTIPTKMHSQVVQFTALRNGEYSFEMGTVEEKVQIYASLYDEQVKYIPEIWKNNQYVYQLTAGKTYYVLVEVYDGDQILETNPLTVSLYVGQPGQGCVFELTKEIPATCTTEGQRVYTCTRHAAQETRTEVIPKTGHTPDAGTITVAPTAIAEGTLVHKCSVCGAELTTEKIAKLTPTIQVNASSLTLKAKQKTTKFVVSGLAAGDYVKKWRTDNASVATVKGKANGTCTITAQKNTGNAVITVVLASGLEKDIKVKVQKGDVKAAKITGVAKAVSIAKGKTMTLKPVVQPFTTSDKLTYSSDNKKIVTVNAKGQVKAVAVGKAKITIKAGSKKFVCTVTVPGAKTTAISGIASALTLKKGKSTTLKPKLAPANSSQAITYKSSNKKVVTVNEKGKLTAKAKGTAVITVKSGSISVKCTVTVK